MQLFKRLFHKFQSRPRKEFHEMSDWILALLGASSFLIAGYWVLAVYKILPTLIDLTNQHGLTWIGTVMFTIIGALGVKIWFFGNLAKRCNTLLIERHFR